MGIERASVSDLPMLMAGSDPVSLFLDLLEAGGEKLPAKRIRECFPEVLSYLEGIGAVQPDALLTELTCPNCDLDHSAAIEFDPSRHTYRFFCPESGFSAVAGADVAAVCVKTDWVLDWLARSLPFNPQIRRRTLVERRGWLLGEMALGSISVTAALVLGRLAANEQDALIQGISRFRPLGIGIVLTSSAELSSELLALYGYHALDLREVINASDEGLAFDYARLTARAVQFSWGTKATKGAGGRSSQAGKIRDLFAERRNQGVPYRNKSAEANGIQDAWPARFPGEKMPGHSTIRNLLPDADSDASKTQPFDILSPKVEEC